MTNWRCKKSIKFAPKSAVMYSHTCYIMDNRARLISMVTYLEASLLNHDSLVVGGTGEREGERIGDGDGEGDGEGESEVVGGGGARCCCCCSWRVRSA